MIKSVKNGLSLVAGVGLALAASVSALAQDIVAVSWSGSTYAIDGASGSGALIGPSGFSGLNAMAKDSSGKLWTTSSDDLLTVDPITGAASFVVTMNNGVNSVRGMAWYSSRLYVVQDGGSTTLPDELYVIDVATGNATLIGIMNYPNIQGLATDGATMWAWSIFDGLLTVNIGNGICTDVNPGIGATFDIQTLALDGNGRMYGCRDSLYTIDKVTGAQALVGSGGYSDVRGMEFVKSGSPNLGIDVSGACPGRMQFFVTGATPNRPVALLYAFCNTGSIAPSGACAGTPLDLCLAGLRVAAIANADASGFATVVANVPAAACQGYVEWIDATTCNTSVAVPLF